MYTHVVVHFWVSFGVGQSAAAAARKEQREQIRKQKKNQKETDEFSGVRGARKRREEHATHQTAQNRGATATGLKNSRRRTEDPRNKNTRAKAKPNGGGRKEGGGGRYKAKLLGREGERRKNQTGETKRLKTFGTDTVTTPHPTPFDSGDATGAHLPLVPTLPLTTSKEEELSPTPPPPPPQDYK